MRSSPYQTFPDMSQGSNTERIAYIRSKVVFQTEARLDFKRYLHELMQNPSPSAERLVFMTAPSGMGLTWLIEEFIAQNPPFTQVKTGKSVIPVINEHIHPNGEIIDYCDSMRSVLAVPGYGAMTRKSSYPKTLELIGHLQTKLVILEDFHRTHSFMKHQKIAYQNYVHHLISKYDVRVFLTGPPNIWRWAMEDEQTLGRAVQLQYHEWTSNDDDFIEFLEGFERWCPVRNGSSLSRDPKLRKALIRKSRGVSRFVMRELTSLAIFAIISGRERLDLEAWLDLRDRSLP